MVRRIRAHLDVTGWSAAVLTSSNGGGGRSSAGGSSPLDQFIAILQHVSKTSFSIYFTISFNFIKNDF
jgi:hypothetical protein